MERVQPGRIDDGNNIDKDKIENGHVTGDAGFMIHGINGITLIPLLGLALLIVAFFAKIPGGVKWAAILFGLILVQAVLLPILSSAVPFLGVLHGANALVILALSIIGAKRAATAQGPTGAAAGTAV